MQGPENSSLPPALVAIDDTQAGFTPDLLHLDEIPSRTFDTAFIFYVKTGQKKAEDILFNVVSKPISMFPVVLIFVNLIVFFYSCYIKRWQRVVSLHLT